VQNFNSVLDPFTAPPLGDQVTVTGTVHYDGSFRIVPRNPADIVDGGPAGVGGGTTKLAFSVAPNPARVAKFTLTLPQAMDAEVGIYDVAGRQIAALIKGHLPAGPHTPQRGGTAPAGPTAGARAHFAR